MTEVEIIEYCKRGDSKGFKQLVDTYSSKLYGICLRYMNNEFEAKDVLQESFIKIFNSITHYECTGSFEGWMSKIAVNSSLMALRKNKYHFSPLEPLNDVKSTSSLSIDIENIMDESDILDMLMKLPHHYRVIFNLAVIEGYKHSEIAKILEIAESTSRTKLARARKKMQDIYIKEMGIAPKCLTKEVRNDIIKA